MDSKNDVQDNNQRKKIQERIIQIAENPISTTKQTAATTATAKEIIENRLSSSNMH